MVVVLWTANTCNNKDMVAREDLNPRRQPFQGLRFGGIGGSIHAVFELLPQQSGTKTTGLKKPLNHTSIRPRAHRSQPTTKRGSPFCAYIVPMQPRK